ncbi:MAG: TRAP transporter substrate-binding protein [Planctomycetes bacterium]|nr:TRAP transporter substrate-binding protein [Planctomycetota bacterium]
MKKKCIGLSAAAVLFLIGFLFSVQAGQIAIEIAVHTDPGHPVFTVGEKMKENVERLSNGRITARILGLEVGGERDHLEGCSTGEYTIALGGNVPLTLYAPRFAAPDLPFVYSTTEQSRALYQGELGRLMNEDLIRNGNMRLVGLTYRPARKLTSIRPINNLADLRGLKLRVPQVAIYVTMWNALGALTSPIAWAEVYTALQSGVIEAQENPVDLIYNSRIYEVQRFIMETNHVYSFFHWLMNEDFYQKLSEEDKKIVQQAIDETTAWGDELIMGEEGRFFDLLLSEGKMTSVTPNMDEIKKAAFPIIEEACKTYHPEVAKYVLGLAGK